MEKFIEKTFDFVIKRKKKDGGFAATPLLPSTIEDTYFALDIIKTLKSLKKDVIVYEPSEDKELKNWLEDKLNKLQEYENSYKILWYILRIYQYIFTHIELEIKKRYVSFFPKKLESISILDLEKFYYLLKIAKILKLRLNFTLRFFEFRTIKELYMILWIYDNFSVSLNLSLEKNLKKMINWIERCYNPDGGFGFSPGATSYLENTYFALRCYQILNRIPSQVEKIKEFVLSCYGGQGGFSRKPDGASFLESSYYGVRCMKIVFDLCKGYFQINF